MNFMFKIFFSILISTLSVHLVWASIPVTQAILYENGTCTEEPLPEMPSQVINTNGTVDDFLKSLPSDNRVLAELLCQSDQ
jgi:hypothetical protein